MGAARPFSRALLLSAAVVAAGLAGAAPASAISGGAAEPGAFVAQVGYGPAGYDGSTSCSGALISARYVLTAKSCFGAVSGAPEKSLTVTLPGYSLPGTEIVPHPGRDVALVRLAADLPATVTPAVLATAPPAEGTTLSMAGFGRTATEWIPGRAHVAPMTVSGVGATTLDVQAESGVSTCRGDAGGPAYTIDNGRATIAAIHGASWQQGCLGSDSVDGGAVEVRVDDLGPWVDGLLRVRGNPDVLRNAVSKMCLAIDGAKKTAGARLSQWWCTDGPDTHWVQTALGGSLGNTVLIRSVHSNLCAGVKTSTAYNAPVSQEACSGTGQQWMAESTATGAVRYRNKLTNSCLADPASNMNAGTLLITWTCNDLVRADQHWQAQARDVSRLLRNNVTNGCVRSGGAAAGYLVDQENCHDDTAQRFSFPSRAGTTTIVHESTGHCLSAADNQRTQVRVDPCDGGDRQLWTVTASTVNGNAVVRFQNVFSGLCMGVSGANTAEGTRVIQWPCGSADHWFRA